MMNNYLSGGPFNVAHRFSIYRLLIFFIKIR